MMMNTERILKLADVIEAQPLSSFCDDHGFGMNHWEHHCGTPSCIAGWAIHLSGAAIVRSCAWTAAQGLLDLDDEQSGELFYPDSYHGPWDEITPVHAAAVLRNLAATGEVDWSVGASASVEA